MVEIDYPRKKVLADALKAQNENLEKLFGIDVKGFPTVIVVSPEGKILGEFTGYGGETPAEIIVRLEKMRGS